MTSTPPNTTPAPVLSLLVLLPQAAHIPDLAPQPTSSSRTLARPSPLTSRQSQGHVPSLGSLAKNPQEPAQDAGEIEIDKMISAGRRMSLAPGIGGGTQTKSPTTAFTSKLSVINSSPQSDQEDFEAYTYPSPGPSAPPTPAPPAAPAFGSSRGGVRPSRNRRPATATLGSSGTSPMAMGMTNAGSSSGVGQGGMSRASISGRGMGRISGIGGSLGKTRPGWEGDEVVGVLRSSGMEVTVVRNASQIPSVLSPTSTSTPSFGSLDQQSNFPGSRSLPSSSRPFTPVILVPLSDILTIPSLSLLLQQGTTPTAVCFQQDLLERARKTEEEWLPHALDQIRSVVEMRDRGLMTHDNSGLPPISETPVILAYSANPALSSSTIAACVGVGAAGVLKPPYDLETSRLVRRMVRAAREGRVSSVVGLPAYLLPSAMPGHSTPNEGLSEDEEDTRRQVGRVILPPTALSMGGEHEGEKVLSGAFHKQHRRGTSTQWDLGSNMTPSGRSREMSAPYTIQRKQSNPPPGQVAPSTSVQSIITSSSSKSRFSAFSQDERDIDHAERHQLTSLYHYNPTLQQRRRSVDTSGLGLALLRAQRVFEKQQSVPSLLSPAAMSRSHSLGVQDDDDEKSYSANSTPRLGSKAFTPKSAARPHSAVRGLAMGSNASLTRAVDERDDHDHEHRDGDRCKDTELAELLSAMYYQTRLAIDIQMDEYEQFAAPMSPEQRSRLVEHMSTWHFKPHNLDDGDLFRCACIMFDGILNIEGLAELEVDRDSLYRLLFAIKAIYHAPNPYHNYVHAIDVLQATYSFLAELGLAPPYSYIQQMTPQSAPWKRPADAGSSAKGSGTLRARETFRPQDVLAVLVAAMGHDVGHPGLSNAFMKNAKTPLSQVYEDKSVLENMHCMLVVQLIRKHGFGFLIDPAPSTSDNGPQRFDTRGFRNVLYSSILATDMSLHFAWMQSLEDFEGQVSSGLGIYDYKNGTRGQGVARDEKVESDRILIAQAIIKCADISNPTRPIDVSEHWSSVLLKEWAVQASLETDLQLPVSVIASADAALQAKGQIGFIKLFTQPLFDAVSRVLPELRNYAEWCSQNRAIWEGRHETMQQDAGDSRIVQPAVEDAAHDERFSTLFPLSLPTSLVALASLEPGPTLADPQGHLAPGYSLSQATPPRTARSTSGVLSPGFNEEGYPAPQFTQSHGPHLGHSDSPSAKAMRAVYHANLLDQRHRLSSWTRGVPIPGIKPSLNHRAYLEIRRSSTPGYLGFAH